MDGIPPVLSTDSEDVVWALQTAEALWKRGERVDAIVWLRRAAQSAGESEDDTRAVMLARSAAELTEFLAVHSASGAPPAPASDPNQEAVDDLLSVPPHMSDESEVFRLDVVADSLRDPVISDPEVLTVTASSPDILLVDAVDAAPEIEVIGVPASTSAPEIDDLEEHHDVLEEPEEVEERPRSAVQAAPTAAEVHAGMLDPWADAERRSALPALAPKAMPPPAPKRPPPPPPIRASRPSFDEEEVVTSAKVRTSPPLSPPPPSMRSGATTAPAPSLPIAPTGAPPVPPRPKPPLPKRATLPVSPPKRIAPPDEPVTKAYDRPKDAPAPESLAASLAFDSNDLILELDAVTSVNPPPSAPPRPPQVPPRPPQAPPRPPAPPPPPTAPTLPELLDRATPVPEADEPEEPELDTELLRTVHPSALPTPMPPSLDTPPPRSMGSRITAPPPRSTGSKVTAPPASYEEPEITPLPEAAADATDAHVAIDAAMALPPALMDLSTIEALGDLPDDARDAFAQAASINDLARDEEVSHFALALVVEGDVDVSSTLVDAPALRLERGSVLRSRGTLDEGVQLRLVCASDTAKIATWDDAAVEAAFRTCPWVEDDLRAVADRVQTKVGVTMGPLGERFDMALREHVTSVLTVKSLAPGETVVEAGKPVPLVIVGVGEIELVKPGAKTLVLRSGDILFATEIMGGGMASATARAGKGGALVLYGNRRVASELMMSFPPLLEIFASM